MSKTKILLLQIVGCLALGAVLGVAFWLCDGGREQDYREVLDEIRIVKPKKWIMLSGTCTVFGKSTPMKVYRGKGHNDCLEVVK